MVEELDAEARVATLAAPRRRVTALRVVLVIQVLLLVSFIGCLILVPVVRVTDAAAVVAAQRALSTFAGFLMVVDFLVGVGYAIRWLIRRSRH